MNETRVGFIGLGSQGAPMARRIIGAGYPVTLWARRPGTLEPFADTGAKTAGTPAELAAASDLVCLCVTADADVEQVIAGEGGVLAALAEGGVIAVHSTVHPDTCRRLAAEAATRGIRLIDAPVSGGAPAASAGRLLVMVGGDEPTVEFCRPVFASYGDPVVHLGPLGAGLVTKHHFWPRGVPGRRFLVTDGNAGRLYGEFLEPLAARIRIMPGEQSKTIAHAEIVWTELVRAGMTRADVVVALGGGVVGDLAGFCAATYQRGVRYVQVPTTLVAQVDSAYGGKTGVDLAEAKNYIGAFHQPSAVIADTATLQSLPEAELAAGYAEVVKTALIAGGQLWERVRAGADPADPALITACARAKLRIVAGDERDAGLRQVLNLGHTVGHAIEAATGYAAYRHGEAVALGLLAALRLSDQEELRAEVAELLADRGLPTKLKHADADAVVMATARDKKRVGTSAVPFVLLDAPGNPRAGCQVPSRDLVAAVRELSA